MEDTISSNINVVAMVHREDAENITASTVSSMEATQEAKIG